MIVTRPQLEIFTGTGAMKSLSSAPNDAEARLLMKVLPNASQVPAGNTPRGGQIDRRLPELQGREGVDVIRRAGEQRVRHRVEVVDRPDRVTPGAPAALAGGLQKGVALTL